MLMLHQFLKNQKNKEKRLVKPRSDTGRCQRLQVSGFWHKLETEFKHGTTDRERRQEVRETGRLTTCLVQTVEKIPEH